MRRVMMSGKVVISVDKKGDIKVSSDLSGDSLIKAYEALTAHIALQLKEPDDIIFVSNKAANEALPKVHNAIK